MLRHLRMASVTKKLPRSEGQLFGMIQEWCRPLYRYRIPHTPTPRDRVCTCAYPLYTLRSSRRSPYDEPTMYASVHETIYATGADAPSTGDTPASSWTSSGCLSPVYTSTTTTATGGVATSSFLSSFRGLPSLRARWAVRRRGLRQVAVPPTTPAAAPPQSSERCYRCDICDGLQGRAEASNSALATSGSSVSAGIKMTAHPTTATTTLSAEWNEEDEAGETTGVTADSPDSSLDERYGYTISTDIANTAMEDADVAELRHLDPFHVEVFGRPLSSALIKRIVREVQAQLTRCGLRKRDASRYAAQAALNSEMSLQTYKLWVRQESHRIRERRLRLTTPAAAIESPSSKSQLTVASSAVIIKGKLDTLDTASYLARYAIAAYGLPFELNYFSSLRELAKLMAEPHRRYVCANSEEQLESMRRMLQGEEPDALLECVASRYSLRIGQACWSVFLDHAAHRVVLTFRGSLTLADIVVDVTEGYANVVLERTPLDGAVAATGTDASQRLCTAIPLGFYESVVEAGAQLLPVLRTIHTQYSDYELCITGHSLGGIQASLFHLLYCGPWRATLHSSTTLLRRAKALTCPSLLPSAPPSPSAAILSGNIETTKASTAAHVPFTKIVTCTFGAAPVVERRVVPLLNAWLRQEEHRSGSRLVTFSNGMDVICRLQLRSLQDVFVRQYARPTEESLFAGDKAAGDDTGAATAAPVSDKSVPLLAIPGLLYNMTSGTRRRHLLAVPLTATAVREQVILIPEAVLHHYPSLYLRSLNDLLRRYGAKWQSMYEAAATTPTATATAAAAAVPTDHSLQGSQGE
ncbi:lipase, putative [Leishmania panamensis]|uniref:sn-1-specific diacylglycerol lipase n=1 Tax=Leishmania panamensis TaxID=5679 RepID=A0A088RYN7_LEIPA|nr:lipase, putative [Leishmania panamensis]AIO01238.1 lipase, putative [Leishmania panamensis]